VLTIRSSGRLRVGCGKLLVIGGSRRLAQALGRRKAVLFKAALGAHRARASSLRRPTPFEFSLACFRGGKASFGFRGSRVLRVRAPARTHARASSLRVLVARPKQATTASRRRAFLSALRPFVIPSWRAAS
jgi:hypothetical protein